MNLDVTDENAVKKHLFTLKPKQRDGLILNVYHTNKKNQKIRIIRTCISSNGQTLACADKGGNIFIIDFLNCKFWKLPKVVDSCTCLQFSQWIQNDILIATLSGKVKIIDVNTSKITGDLIGHVDEVRSVSFAQQFLCLTSSKLEAIIWDLRTNSKVHVLNLDKNCHLKEVRFMPVTSNILAYYDDDVIEIWKYGTFQSMMVLQPIIWNKHCIRNVTFTLNGQLMVLALHPSQLAVFLINTWKLTKIVNLPEYVQAIKHIEFVANLNDGGCNKILTILSGQGNVYFYDVEQNIMLSELTSEFKITRYDCASKGNFIACVLSSGDVSIYDFLDYITMPKQIKAETISARRKIKPKECVEKLGLLKEQIKEILDIEKLRQILKQYGEYPDMYRTTIWEQLLELPNNRSQYNAVINHRIIISFSDLYQKYPLENKRNLKNLRKVLDNLVTWCPFFANVDYLPVLLFPFVEVFQNKPVACFEAACTIIVNWCQFWFEYFPLPPINILTIIENILLEQDPELLDHLTKFRVPAVIYAWPLLETGFSEVLTAPEWKKLWDHVLTSSDQSFLLFAVVAYNILQRRSILSFNEPNQFVSFYRNRYPFELKKLISKSYHLSNTTSQNLHPNQYLNAFKKIDPRKYPEFNDYPKTVLIQAEKLKKLDDEIKEIRDEEGDLIKQRLENLRKIEDFEIDDAERKRIINLEKVITSQIIEKQSEVKDQYERLSQLRHKLKDEENEILKVYKQRILDDQEKTKGKLLESIQRDLDLKAMEEDYSTKRAEDNLLTRYSELLKLKQTIEGSSTDSSEKSGEEKRKTRLQKHQDQLDEEVERVQKLNNSDEKLKLMNVAAGIATTEVLIKKIEQALEREKCNQMNFQDQKLANLRVLKLKAESADLVMNVNKLLKILSHTKGRNVPSSYDTEE